MTNVVVDDGFVRMTLDQFRSLQFTHLLSRLDEIGEMAMRCGAPTLISGYTEWVAKTDPSLSVGWDWVVDPTRGMAVWRRIGLPRTNVRLVEGRDDYHWRINLDAVTAVVDAWPWQDQARLAIEMQYA